MALRSLRRWQPWLELALGLGVAASGIAHTLWALPAEWHELRPSGHHGVLLLGLATVARAVSEIGVNLQYAAGLTAPAEPTVWMRLRARLTSPGAEGTVGLLIIAAGLASALQAARLEALQAPTWHWGLLLIGVAIVVRAAQAFFEGLEKLGTAGGPRWLQGLAGMVHHPASQVGLAVALVALAVGEVLDPSDAAAMAGLVPGTEAAEGAGAPVAHHGLSAFAGSSLARALPDLMNGGKRAWQSFSEHREAS